MAAERPQAALQDLLPAGAAAAEGPQLAVGPGLDPDGPAGDRRGQEVQAAQGAAGPGQHRVEGKAAEEDQHGREQVEAEKADQPVRPSGGGPAVGVAPVLVGQPPPPPRPVGGQAHRPERQQRQDRERRARPAPAGAPAIQ
jgi:hypothetical protein